ncbi:hypothetical protein AWB75_01596 [Caballeronia catudaia]|uniref:Uncharacterized protein n=1 Tax=Caballeronia catudaia TaxID=1777136 RepID=A0A158A168_9BURK|nr:hypothetical protein AWB75_01596 [Caballeronia catudaia]
MPANVVPLEQSVCRTRTNVLCAMPGTVMVLRPPDRSGF